MEILLPKAKIGEEGQKKKPERHEIFEVRHEIQRESFVEKRDLVDEKGPDADHGEKEKGRDRVRTRLSFLVRIVPHGAILASFPRMGKQAFLGCSRLHVITFWPFIRLSLPTQPFSAEFFWMGRQGHSPRVVSGMMGKDSPPREKPSFPGLLLIHGGPSRTNKEPFPMMTTGLNRLIEPNMSSSL